MIVSSFLSYLILFVILVAIAVCGAMLGVKLAKRKNAKNAQQNTVAEDTTAQEQSFGGRYVEEGWIKLIKKNVLGVLREQGTSCHEEFFPSTTQ